MVGAVETDSLSVATSVGVSGSSPLPTIEPSVLAQQSINAVPEIAKATICGVDGLDQVPFRPFTGPWALGVDMLPPRGSEGAPG
nr:hypothetical protein GCM10025732_06240 [Glycomyces mayteni]